MIGFDNRLSPDLAWSGLMQRWSGRLWWQFYGLIWWSLQHRTGRRCCGERQDIEKMQRKIVKGRCSPWHIGLNTCILCISISSFHHLPWINALCNNNFKHRKALFMEVMLQIRSVENFYRLISEWKTTNGQIDGKPGWDGTKVKGKKTTSRGNKWTQTSHTRRVNAPPLAPARFLELGISKR